MEFRPDKNRRSKNINVMIPGKQMKIPRFLDKNSKIYIIRIQYSKDQSSRYKKNYKSRIKIIEILNVFLPASWVMLLYIIANVHAVH